VNRGKAKTPGGVEEFVLTFAVTGLSRATASAKFRIWRAGRAREPFVIVTQLPQAEYDGPSITEAANFALDACRGRVGPRFTYIEHYNRASYGLDVYEPSFNRIEFEYVGAFSIRGTPSVGIAEICAATGLTEQEVLRL
jgi:hypothetical protein